jgi:hypothetical protein
MSFKPASPVEQIAMELTLQTIERRISSYRNLVVLVLAVVIGSAVSAMVYRSWRLLLCVILILPATAVYLLIDRYYVQAWVRCLLDLERDQHLNLEVFSHAACGRPFMPAETLRTMLARLGAHSARR